MKLNRTGVAVGLAVGLLAGGAGGVLAANGGRTATTPSTAVAQGMTGMCAMSIAGPTNMATAAEYLGLTQADLQARLRTGESLADVAKAQGKSVAGLEDAIVAALESRLDANTALTADQKAAILAQAKRHVSAMVTMSRGTGMGSGLGSGRFGGPGMGHGGMMGAGMMGGATSAAMWR
jgi:hypothetical protein